MKRHEQATHVDGRALSSRRRRRVFQRDGQKCRACGSTTNLTIDHITPKSRGGSSELHNLQTLCLRCNQRKADTRPGDSTKDLEQAQRDIRIANQALAAAKAAKLRQVRDELRRKT